MKKLFIVIILSLTCFFNCRTKETHSNWKDNRILVDGDVSDWGNIPIILFEKSDIHMRIINDSEYFYCTVGFRDQTLAQMFKINGITLWLDRKAKNKRDFGIIYRSDIPIDDDMQRDKEFMGKIPPEQKARLEKMQKDIPKGIFVIDKNGYVIPLSLAYGPICALELKNGIYNMEFMIPLKITKDNPYAINTSMGEKMSLGIEMDIFSKKEREKLLGDMDRMGGPGGGGPGGGRGPGGGGRGDDFRKIPEKQELWIKIVLASKTE